MVYVSRLWLLKWEHLARPGPIDHSAFHCPHGRAHVLAREAGRLRACPRSVFEELVARHGGGPAVEALGECPACVELHQALDRRRAEEQRRVHACDQAFVEAGESWYLIDKHWLSAWLAFVDEESSAPPPGPISNDRLLDPGSGAPRAGLQKGRDYRGINEAVWAIFHGIYGGGPPIIRPKLDIYCPAQSAEA